jgi:hypothetical protein
MIVSVNRDYEVSGSHGDEYQHERLLIYIAV